MRINSAKDDAAGLAISQRMTAQIRALIRQSGTRMMASRSHRPPVGLQETTAILQRMRELSVQAANDTNTGADRGDRDEVDALRDEMDRIAGTTTFNNQNILDGTFLGARFHIGANANEGLDMFISDARSTMLGRQARYSVTMIFRLKVEPRGCRTTML